MASDLDMYADDFDLKEKEKLENPTQSNQEESEEPEDQVTGTIIFYYLEMFKRCYM